MILVLGNMIHLGDDYCLGAMNEFAKCQYYCNEMRLFGFVDSVLGSVVISLPKLKADLESGPGKNCQWSSRSLLPSYISDQPLQIG